MTEKMELMANIAKKFGINPERAEELNRMEINFSKLTREEWLYKREVSKIGSRNQRQYA